MTRLYESQPKHENIFDMCVTWTGLLPSHLHPASWFFWYGLEATPARGNPSERNRKSGQFQTHLYIWREVVCFSISMCLFLDISYHSEVSDLLHDSRPERLEGLLGIAAPGSKRICRHLLFCCKGNRKKILIMWVQKTMWSYTSVTKVRLQQQSVQASFPEYILCVTTTHPLMAYHYSTIKSK